MKHGAYDWNQVIKIFIRFYLYIPVEDTRDQVCESIGRDIHKSKKKTPLVHKLHWGRTWPVDTLHKIKDVKIMQV